MADAKISQLPVATSSAGTDVLPIVQSSTTKQLAIQNLVPQNLKSNATTGVLQVTGPAAGTTRVMTAPDANFTAARTDAAQSFTGDQTLATGNIIQGTAAKGLNFTANTPAAGMTSQLLNWYEEGTWTPVLKDSGGNVKTLTTALGYYTRIGRQVTIWFSCVSSDSLTDTYYYQLTSVPFYLGSSPLNGSSVGAVVTGTLPGVTTTSVIGSPYNYNFQILTSSAGNFSESNSIQGFATFFV